MKVSYFFQALFIVFLSISIGVAQNSSKEKSDHRVKSVNIQILSTQVADSGIGEWGFAALVEVDGKKILFDTGALPDTVSKNTKELNVDLSDISDVILSHNHSDHTGGLIKLRREYMKKSRTALTRAHIGKGMFWSRPLKSGGEGNDMIALQPEYKAIGGKFIEHTEAEEIMPGVWVTGSIARTYPEKNFSGLGQMKTPDGLADDNIPEELSLVVNTDQGLVVISGCGHAGIINTLEHARKTVRNAPIYAVIGGFHLFEASDETLDWTANKLKEFGTKNFMGAHCTGFEAVYRIRQHAGLDRKTCVVGAVGAGFSLDKGIDPQALAQ
jgi:7,8-dihydropterin-6-yl-methyl-4-(beta-D-ribofuranosyl)aminobenzene 5'-phosphate synthase